LRSEVKIRSLIYSVTVLFILTQQGLHVSQGSVGNIIRAQTAATKDVESSLLNTAADINETGSPSSIGDGLAERSEGLDIDFSDTSYPESYPNPNIEPTAIINQNIPQQNDTTEEKSSKANQYINTLSGAENQSDLETFTYTRLLSRRVP
jgi:hypothetical protein